MRTVEEKGLIVIKEKGITYNICELIQTTNGDSFNYIFKPNYQVIDLLPKDVGFEGIQGLDLSLKEREYYREGIPTFVSERVPPSNRIELDTILKEVGLSYYDPIQLMIKSKEKYCGDNLMVIPFMERKAVDIQLEGTTNTYKTVSDIVRNIAINNIVTTDGEQIVADLTFKLYYPIYLDFYNKLVKKQLISGGQNGKGRPKVNIKQEDFEQILKLYRAKQISMSEALRTLKISRSTFIRMARLCQK